MKKNVVYYIVGNSAINVVQWNSFQNYITTLKLIQAAYKSAMKLSEIIFLTFFLSFDISLICRGLIKRIMRLHTRIRIYFPHIMMQVQLKPIECQQTLVVFSFRKLKRTIQMNDINLQFLPSLNLILKWFSK